MLQPINQPYHNVSTPPVIDNFAKCTEMQACLKDTNPHVLRNTDQTEQASILEEGKIFFMPRTCVMGCSKYEQMYLIANKENEVLAHSQLSLKCQ